MFNAVFILPAIDNFFALTYDSKVNAGYCSVKNRVSRWNWDYYGCFFFVLFWTEARPSAVAMLLTQSLWEQRRQLPPPGKCSEVGIPTVVPFCFYVDRAGSPHKWILKEILAYSPGSQMRRNSTSVKCDSRINFIFELAKKVHLTETLNHLFNQCSDFSPILEGKTISGEYVSVEGTILFNLIGFNIECATFPH